MKARPTTCEPARRSCAMIRPAFFFPSPDLAQESTLRIPFWVTRASANENAGSRISSFGPAKSPFFFFQSLVGSGPACHAWVQLIARWGAVAVLLLLVVTVANARTCVIVFCCQMFCVPFRQALSETVTKVPSHVATVKKIQGTAGRACVKAARRATAPFLFHLAASKPTFFFFWHGYHLFSVYS